MPLSKAKDKERKKRERDLSNLSHSLVQPNLTQPDLTQPRLVQPNLHPRYGEFSNIAEQVRALYPDGKLPNCKDGRYR